MTCRKRRWDSVVESLFCTDNYCGYKEESDFPLDDNFDKVAFSKMLTETANAIPKDGPRSKAYLV